MNQITFTQTSKSGYWSPSMSGIGMVATDDITRVRWNDIAETVLVVVGTEARVWHAGQRHDLKRIAGNHDTIVSYWRPRIQKRLESQRLQDRVRNWRTEAAA